MALPMFMVMFISRCDSVLPRLFALLPTHFGQHAMEYMPVLADTRRCLRSVKGAMELPLVAT